MLHASTLKHFLFNAATAILRKHHIIHVTVLSFSCLRQLVNGQAQYSYPDGCIIGYWIKQQTTRWQRTCTRMKNITYDGEGGGEQAE